MKHYKKRTIALILASVVTVVGAFGAENYKNTLMSLKFDNVMSSSGNVTIFTKNNYEKELTPVKINSNTYVIMLPETNSAMQNPPEISGAIEKVDIRTMPYTNSSQGYTKITIKTNSNFILEAKKAIYIPEKKNPELENKQTQPQQQAPQVNYQNNTYNNYNVEKVNNKNSKPNTPINNYQEYQSNNKYSEQNVQTANTYQKQENYHTENTIQNEPTEQTDIETADNLPVQNNIDEKNGFNASEILFLFLGILLVIVTSIYFFVKGKNQISEILGEQADFDIDDDTNASKKKKTTTTNKKNIKNVINKLDKQYVPTVNITPAIQDIPAVPTPVEVIDDENIVDLDEIFNTQNKNQEIIKESNEYNSELSNENINETENNTEDNTEEEENLALEEFLKAYVFEDDEEKNVINSEETEEAYDKELYEKYINDENLEFNSDDISKIQMLLNSEINDETIKNLDKYLVTNPIEKTVSHKELLENFVTTYAINQNIIFTDDDIKALDKLMSVELDNNFITDLRTNPQRIKNMQEEIENNKSIPHKKSEILTLNVKDMLPNLSEALKKQGNKQIESEYKPEVIYYSEGYDVNVISLKDQLPDLSVEINNKESYISRPSDEIEYSESGYDVDKLSVSEEFLDLDAMLKHQEELDALNSKPIEIDEEALLRNITNVTFKPFYEEENNNYEENAPSFSDIQAEFKELNDNVEIIKDNETEIINSTNENERDDFESLFSNEYIDFDNPINTSPNVQNSEEILPVNETQALLNTIKQKQQEKLEKLNQQNNSHNENIHTEEKEKTETKSEAKNETIINTCIIDDSIYEIVSTTNFTENMGCYLAKNNSGYCVLGFVGEKLFKIKYYEKLKTEKIQARKTEKIDKNIYRYIVRIGIHKFIMNVSKDNMEFIMDLC